MRGPPVSPTPQGSMLVGASSSHKPALLCVCLLGGQGNSFVCFCFPLLLLLLFGLWLAPKLGSVEGGDASREGVEEPGGGHGFVGEFVRV